MSAAASYPIESVENAARVLLMLREKRVIRVAEVAAELGIARSSAHRMLTTLQSQGLLRQDPATRGYGAGAQLVQIGVAVIGATDLKADARATLERLSRQSGETVHLIALEGVETVFLDGVEGRYAIRAAERTGDRSPAHASAAGKVLLASLSREQLRQLYPGSRIQGGTDQAVTSRRELEAQLEAIRVAGFGLNLGESEPGLHAVSAPIRDGAGSARAALSISGPSVRLDRQRLEEFSGTLRDAADSLGALLA